MCECPKPETVIEKQSFGLIAMTVASGFIISYCVHIYACAFDIDKARCQYIGIDHAANSFTIIFFILCLLCFVN